jgi:hypothetical protein
VGEYALEAIEVALSLIELQHDRLVRERLLRESRGLRTEAFDGRIGLHRLGRVDADHPH